MGLLLWFGDGALAQQVKLKAALQVPITELLFGRSLAEFKQEVETLTRNDVAIEIFDGGKVGCGADIGVEVASGIRLDVLGLSWTPSVGPLTPRA